MSEMIERVAKAIWFTNTQQAGRGHGYPILTQEALEREWIAFSGDAAYASNLEEYRENARDAIEAMREPTGAMINITDEPSLDDAFQASHPDSEGSFAPGGARKVWTAMIDEALK